MTSHLFHPWGEGNRVIRRSLVLVVALFSAGMANAQSGPDEGREAEKQYWQALYRALLRDQATLRAEIESARGPYADANRRNYRRGAERHFHHDAMVESERKLAVVEKQLGKIQEEGRRAGALPGGFYEIDSEFEAASPAESPAAGSNDSEDDGRNPL